MDKNRCSSNIGEHDQSCITDQENACTSSVEDHRGNEVPKKEESGLPLEMQCVAVDMNDPDMDLLEWTARKLVPIPKAYFWETGNRNIPMRTKIWHRTVAGLGTLLRWSEKIGETVAKLTGVNDSRFEHITATMTPEQWQDAERNAENQRAKRRAYLRSLEAQKVEEETAEEIGVTHQAL